MPYIEVKGRASPLALILVPTREIAFQTLEQINKVSFKFVHEPTISSSQNYKIKKKKKKYNNKIIK